MRRRPSKRSGSSGPGGGAGPVSRTASAYDEDARRLAAEFVAEVRRRYGAVLGFELDAVRVLDRVLGFVRADGARELVLPAGFFFAELLRRCYGGRYAWDARRRALALQIGPLALYPLEKVSRLGERCPAGPAQTLEGFVLVLARRLAGHRPQR
ncbi:MAG: hypothetical protein KatS3mg102_1073 [Planctomycetota bacterium]|nr:MAG: hypothetical protein KatS3mg102_1073 [Planctomycetota bacterium]